MASLHLPTDHVSWTGVRSQLRGATHEVIAHAPPGARIGSSASEALLGRATAPRGSRRARPRIGAAGAAGAAAGGAPWRPRCAARGAGGARPRPPARPASRRSPSPPRTPRPPSACPSRARTRCARGPGQARVFGSPMDCSRKLLTQCHARVCWLLWPAAGLRARPRRRHAQRQAGAPACRRLSAVGRSTTCSSRRCPERRPAAGAPQVHAARAFWRHRHERFRHRLACRLKVPAGSAGGTGRSSPGCRRCT